MNIRFAKMYDDVKIPTKRNNDAGFDIYACKRNSIIIEPHQTVLVPTGLKSIIDDGYYVQIQERGSTGSKGIKYSAGVIDSNFRGEWFLATTNTNNKPLVITNESMSDYDGAIWKVQQISADFIYYDIDKALFQGIVHQLPEVNIIEVTQDAVDNNITDRGTGILGSSNK